MSVLKWFLAKLFLPFKWLWVYAEKIGGLMGILTLVVLFLVINQIQLGVQQLQLSQKSLRKRPINITLLSPLEGQLVREDLEIRGSVTGHPYSDYQIKIDGKLFKGGFNQKIDTTDIPDGQHSLTVSVLDDEGDEKKSKPVVFFVDNTSPDIVVNGISKGDIVEGEVNITTKIFDSNDTTKQVRIDGKYPVINSVFDTEILDEGKHIITVKAEDAAGNKANKSFSFIVNNKPLEITNLSIAGGSLVRGEVEISADLEGFRKGEKQIIVGGECIAKELPYTWDTTEVEGGTHKILVNVSNNPTQESERIESTIKVDNTPPELMLSDRFPDNNSLLKLHRNSILDLTVNANEKLDEVKRVIDGEQYKGKYFSLREEKVGKVINIKFIAVDLAGNETVVKKRAKVVPYENLLGPFIDRWRKIEHSRRLRSIVFALVCAASWFLVAYRG